jgi:hypothetical protein
MALIDDRYRKMLMMDYATKNQGGGLFGSQNQGGLFGNLANINPNILIGANIAGAGLRGQDPFSSVMPSLMQMAKFKKAFTPEFKRPMAVKNKDTGEIRFIDPRKVTEDSPYVPLPKDEMTADMRNHEFYLNIQEKGTPAEKRAADLIFRKRGRDIATKDEYLLNITKNLSKDISYNPDRIQEVLPEYEKIYDRIISGLDREMEKTLPKEEKGRGTKIEVKEEITIITPKDFKGNDDQWRKIKFKNPDVDESILIKWYNEKYGG